MTSCRALGASGRDVARLSSGARGALWVSDPPNGRRAAAFSLSTFAGPERGEAASLTYIRPLVFPEGSGPALLP